MLTHRNRESLGSLFDHRKPIFHVIVAPPCPDAERSPILLPVLPISENHRAMMYTMIARSQFAFIYYVYRALMLVCVA